MALSRNCRETCFRQLRGICKSAERMLRQFGSQVYHIDIFRKQSSRQPSPRISFRFVRHLSGDLPAYPTCHLDRLATGRSCSCESFWRYSRVLSFGAWKPALYFCSPRAERGQDKTVRQ